MQLPSHSPSRHSLTFPRKLSHLPTLAQLEQQATRVCVEPFHPYPSRLGEDSAKPAVPSPAVAESFAFWKDFLCFACRISVRQARFASAIAAVYSSRSVVRSPYSVDGSAGRSRWVRLKLFPARRPGGGGAAAAAEGGIAMEAGRHTGLRGMAASRGSMSLTYHHRRHFAICTNHLFALGDINQFVHSTIRILRRWNSLVFWGISLGSLMPTPAKPQRCYLLGEDYANASATPIDAIVWDNAGNWWYPSKVVDQPGVCDLLGVVHPA